MYLKSSSNGPIEDLEQNYGQVTKNVDIFGAKQFVYPSVTDKDIPSSDMHIPEVILYYMFMINFWGLGLGTSILGIITNILNIITFLRQNMKDAVNVSLFGLAVTDLLSLITLSMVNICFMPSFQALDLPFVAMDFMYIWAWLHIMLTRITSWITAYIIFERCLCIALPLKVKVLITPKKTSTYILALYIIMLVSVAPIYYTTRAANVFDSVQNRTLMGIAMTADRNSVESIAFILNCIVPSSAFVTTTVCTIILVRKLKDKRKWRHKSAGDGQADTMSSRDTKVIRMVVFISTVFIICYSPGVIAFIWVIVDQEMRTDRSRVDLLFTIFSILFHLESINASSGMFVYLLMSSKYKKTFIHTFCCCITTTLQRRNNSSVGHSLDN